MRRDSFKVEDDGSTPDCPLVACIYCGAPVGEEHRERCAMRRRTVVLRATVEYVHEIPEHWDDADVHGFYNDGRWCADNLLLDLAKHNGDDNLVAEAQGDTESCLCGTTVIEFVREATTEDEASSQVRVERFKD